MKAIRTRKYGNPSVLELTEIDKPTPKNNEILVKIHSAAITSAQCSMRQGKPYFGRIFLGFTKPKISIPGTDFAGVVEAVGNDVTKFMVGDAIIAATDLGGGSYAEYIAISENDVIIHKPKNMNFDEAVSIIEGSTTALSFLRDSGKIKPGMKVLIIGASGSVGTAAVQLAKYFKTEVTGVCSQSNIQMVEELGADKVINYTKDDFTKLPEKYDIIFDTVGKSSFTECKNVLTENGVYLSTVLSLKILMQMMWSSFAGKKKAVFSATGLRKPDEKILDLIIIKEMIEEGNLKSIIDKRYKIEQIVEAHEYIETGHKRGNLVLQLAAY